MTVFLWTLKILTFGHHHPSGAVHRQQELMGHWTLWDDMAPIPQAAYVWHSQRRWGLTESSLLHSLWRESLHSLSASFLLDHCNIAALPGVKGLNWPMLSLIWISHMNQHTLPCLLHFSCFFLSIPTLVLSSFFTVQLLFLQSYRFSLRVWSFLNLRGVCLRIAAQFF